MADRLPQALQYTAQGFRVIATQGKVAVERWERFHTQAPTAHDRHRWWPGKRGKHDHNIALILGPKPGGDLLALNVNLKNGVDGFATLARLDWEIPPTPTIITPSRGRCHFFKVPDPALFPFPFATHVHPPGYEGLEFRGARGYQLVPPSRLTHGRYQFLAPWTLEGLRADLAELPEAILQVWVRLDRRDEKVARRRAHPRDHASHDPQPRTASASALPTDPSSPNSATPPSPSHPRTPPMAKATAQHPTEVTQAR